MTNEEAINVLFQVKDALINSNSWLESTKEPITDAFNLAIEALKARQTCNNLAIDTISRQAAINAIRSDKITGDALEVMKVLGNIKFVFTINSACDRHIRAIENLPSM